MNAINGHLTGIHHITSGVLERKRTSIFLQKYWAKG
ncbi:hypothetical protein ERHA55_08670 [Erwinia rhapontici]|nr:hypothetical protein ERHA55_08670 [Erwinia rhapontici]